jgi:hypothetical protein
MGLMSEITVVSRRRFTVFQCLQIGPDLLRVGAHSLQSKPKLLEPHGLRQDRRLETLYAIG